MSEPFSAKTDAFPLFSFFFFLVAHVFEAIIGGPSLFLTQFRISGLIARFLSRSARPKIRTYNERRPWGV